MRTQGTSGEEDAPGTHRDGAGTILVVDDDAMSLYTFCAVLRGAGYHVLGARNPEEAQRFAVAAERIDLLLTDYQMPGMNGLELAAWFHRSHPRLPVLLTTGNPELVEGRVGDEPRIFFRPKPWLPGDLTAAVAGLLSRASATS